MNLRTIFCIIMAGVLLGLPGTPLLVAAQEATEEPIAAQNGLTIHVVQRNENLFRIALQYNTSVVELVELNGLTDATRIDIGQRLLVPGDDVIVEEVPQTHIVQPGETLFSIAQLYGISIEALSEQNEIVDAGAIYGGQELMISPIANTSPVGATPIPTLEPIIVEPGDENLPTVSGNIHIVGQGETLFRIATAYGLTTQELAQANGIGDPTLIYAGQQLIVPNLPDAQISAIDLPEPIVSLDVRPLIFVEGETGVIQLTTNIGATVSGTFLGRQLGIISLESSTSHVMMIGVPVFTEAGIYTVELTIDTVAGTQTSFAFNIRVGDGGYGSQNLDVTDANLTAPAVQDNEIAILTSLTTAITLERKWNGLFSIPAAAAMNSQFGTLRSYNGGPISAYHSGADFASAPGTPILAAASGIVVLADTLNIRGNTIVIDHGWGIYTAYAHHTTLNVSLGDSVTVGQVIGTAGSTGRVTGPHLHWEVWVNGVPVNPITWTQQAFPS